MMEHQHESVTCLDVLLEYHRSRPRIGLSDWREGENRDYPELWTTRGNGEIPDRVHRCLMNFDQRGGDITLEVLAAKSVCGSRGEQVQGTLVGGEFIIRHGMRVVVSSSGLAWWDDLRTSTSYAAPMEMIRRIILDDPRVAGSTLGCSGDI